MKVALCQYFVKDPRVFFAMEQSGTLAFEGKIGTEASNNG